MKSFLVTFGAGIGAFISHLVGGWTLAMHTLLFFMIADYVTGIMVAAVWHNSSKTSSGGISSLIGFKGLCKKVAILLMVGIAHHVDMLVGTNFLRDGVIVGYCINELISILENVSLMGVSIKYLDKILDVLQTQQKDTSGSGIDEVDK